MTKEIATSPIPVQGGLRKGAGEELLARRLKELEAANIVERLPDAGGRGATYRLTASGQELFPALETMGNWAQNWLLREIVRDENLDPTVLMWELRRRFCLNRFAAEGRRLAAV